ncbi:VirB4 family type IV secretion system protein [Clostridium sp. LP20]|uniref:VirB4 family type IV secretion system protein n=1 Tax=Clostridium sp. LP20 TaxID=3418665 RepID=UPI003EE59C80
MEKVKILNYEYNPYFLSKIQPQGGISFEDNIIKKGDGYEVVLHLYDYPTEVEEFWLNSVMNIKNTIVTMDVGEATKGDTLKKLEKSLREQESRYYESMEYKDKLMAKDEFNKLIELQEEVVKYGEVLKVIHLRIYVADRTRAGLEKKVGDILEELENLNYRGAILLNEQEHEWKALFDNYSNQAKYENKREGKGLPSLSLGAGFPFNYTNINDPLGSFLGTTFTGGSVLFDLFHKDKKRKSYNALLTGTTGAGKSTALKKLIYNNYLIGNKVRVIDKSGEFRTLILKCGGKVVSLDGSSGIINPLHIYPTVIDEESNEILDEQCYTVHMSKLSMLYSSLSKNKDNDIDEFDRIVRKFYISYGIDIDKCTQYNANEYPIMSELLEYSKNELYSNVEEEIVRENLTTGKINRLESIILTIEKLVFTYGKLFNGHSTIDDLSDEQLISYEVGTLHQYETQIFMTQIFSVLTSIWGQATQHGKREKMEYEEHGKDIEDVVKFLVVIDEAHNYINSNNIDGIRYILQMEREDRKYFGAVLLANQSIKDYVPQDAKSEAVEELKKLFELTQYKFIMQQDANAIEAIKKIFDGRLTESEIEMIPNLEEGECILSIMGMKNISMQIEITEEERRIFKGGR